MYLMTSASVWVSEGNFITTACALAILHQFSSDHTALTLAAAQAVVLAAKKVKVAHPRLPSVGFRSWSLFLTVSLQVTWVINPAVGCHYFPPGLQLPPQPLRGLLPILLLVNRCTVGVNSLPKTVIRLRFEPGPFCAWVQHTNHSATSDQYLLPVHRLRQVADTDQ